MQQRQQPHQRQSSQPPPNPSQLTHSFTPFVPNNTMRPPQSNGPNGGPPRSLQYPRQMWNGNGPRSSSGGLPGGLWSPRFSISSSNQCGTWACLRSSNNHINPQIFLETLLMLFRVPQRLVHNHTRMRDSQLIFGFRQLEPMLDSEHFSVIFTFRTWML
jgi:hypothetical protein